MAAGGKTRTEFQYLMNKYAVIMENQWQGELEERHLDTLRTSLDKELGALLTQHFPDEDRDKLLGRHAANPIGLCGDFVAMNALASKIDEKAPKGLFAKALSYLESDSLIPPRLESNFLATATEISRQEFQSVTDVEKMLGADQLSRHFAEQRTKYGIEAPPQEAAAEAKAILGEKDYEQAIDSLMNACKKIREVETFGTFSYATYGANHSSYAPNEREATEYSRRGVNDAVRAGAGKVKGVSGKGLDGGIIPQTYFPVMSNEKDPSFNAAMDTLCLLDAQSSLLHNMGNTSDSFRHSEAYTAAKESIREQFTKLDREHGDKFTEILASKSSPLDEFVAGMRKENALDRLKEADIDKSHGSGGSDHNGPTGMALTSVAKSRPNVSAGIVG